MDSNLIERERRFCFDYFYDNFDKSPLTYGLTHDVYPEKHNECSVAASGFMLAAMAVGCDFGYISRAEGEEICIKTLETHARLKTEKGFYYHFYKMTDGTRSRNSELSIMDTGLFIAGALTAGAYFGGKALELARRLYAECDWEYFYCKEKKYFYMASHYGKGFDGYWDVYAEQLILYFLAAGSPKGSAIALEAYNSFARLKGSWGDREFIYSWFGSLFTHQFSHAFLDFKGKKDAFGVDWFENTKLATEANRAFCLDHAHLHAGYKEGWGLTSCETEHGYKGRIGAQPSGNGNTENLSDGTVPPCGALGSMPFTPEISLAALRHYYSQPRLIGKYGLVDAYNTDTGWVSDGYVGIDKGVTLLMLANYEKQTVWRTFCSLPEIQKAFEILQFEKEN